MSFNANKSMVFNHSRVNDTALIPLLIVTGIEIDLFAFSCLVNFPVFAWHEFIFFGALSIVIPNIKKLTICLHHSMLFDALTKTETLIYKID